jgi:uncharacterized SAM-binding protein YcdF (DUF218 family)
VIAYVQGQALTSFLYGLFLWVGWWFLLFGVSYFPWPMKLKRAASVCRRALLFITLCGLLALAAAEIVILGGSKEQPDEGYGAVVILGAGLHGERPSAVLYSRLESGLELLKKNPEAVAVLCGGQGGGEYITEAEAMRRYLAQNGVAENRMLLEERSTDTRENLLFAKELLDETFGEAPPAVVVTNDFHITRSLLLARKAGLTVSGVGAYTPQEGAMRLSLYLREGFALVYAAVFREI